MASNDDNTDKLMKSVGELEFSFKNYAPAVCLLVNEDQSFFHGNSLSYQGLGVYAKNKKSYGKVYNPLANAIKNTQTVWPVGTVFAMSANLFVTTYSTITKINSEASEYTEPNDDFDAENQSSDADIIMSKLRVVSGFYESTSKTINSAGKVNNPQENYPWQVLKVKSITRVLSSGLAMIETEDPLTVTSCFPVPASQEDIANLRVDDALVSLGYPLGQTLQWNQGAVADFNTDELTTFQANINAYAGSEGAPVFERKTGRLLGVLLEGNENPVFVHKASENSPKGDGAPNEATKTSDDKGTSKGKSKSSTPPGYYFSPLKPSGLKPHKVAWISNVVPLKAE